MGVGDKNALLRDGTVAMTTTETPAVGGSGFGAFWYDTAAGGPAPSGGVTFQTAAVGPGTAVLNPMVAALIVPSAFPTGATPSITVKLQATDDSAGATWEDLVFFNNQSWSGDIYTQSTTASNAITASGEYRVYFATKRRMLRYVVTAFAGTSFGLVTIRLELAS
jgi:hypothetical protein